ncbi:hypothetical protein ACI0X9_003303 [Cronobacter turicensis]
MRKGLLEIVLKIFRFKEEKEIIRRREHNDTLYFLRHGRAPVFPHPDDQTD